MDCAINNITPSQHGEILKHEGGLLAYHIPGLHVDDWMIHFGRVINLKNLYRVYNIPNLDLWFVQARQSWP